MIKLFNINNPIINSIITFSPALLAIGIISRTFPITSFLYYSVPIILIVITLLAIILHDQIKLKTSLVILVFIFPVYSLLTSIWSLYPILSFHRSLYLILLYTGIYSIVLLNNQISSDKGLWFLIPANIFVISLSFFSLLTGIPANNWTGGHGLGFMGFAAHQNTLASAVLFTMPGLFFLVSSDQRKVISKKNTSFSFLKSHFLRFKIFVLLITANLTFLLLTYSRASILSLIIGVLLFIALLKNKKLIILLASIFILISLSVVLIPGFGKNINTYLSKDSSPLLSRRTVLWEPSLTAAKNGGLIGLGYGVSAPDIKTPVTTGSHYENGRYIREKGNSILALIEETGLIGLILFLLPVFYIVQKLIINKLQLFTTHYTLLTATLAAMLIHSQFEAWWVGPGSIQLPIYLFVMMIVLDSRCWIPA